MAPARIFVSHCWQDKPFTDALVGALRQAGADVWYDEHNLGAGRLVEGIQRELQARPIFVVVLSKAAFASEWVRHECQWAWNLWRREPQRLLLPVVASAIEPSDFNALLILEDFKRVEDRGHRPYPQPEAIERTLRLLELTPAGQAPAPAAPQYGQDAASLIVQGLALADQGRFEQAIAFFRVAAVLEPNESRAWVQLGGALAAAGRYEEALDACDHGLAMDPGSAVAWYYKAFALSRLGSPKRAVDGFDTALGLNPDLVGAWVAKGHACIRLAWYRKSLEAFERALEIDPTNTASWDGKADALRSLGRTGEARAAARRAKELRESQD